MALKLNFTLIFALSLTGCITFTSAQFERIGPGIPGNEVTFQCRTCGPSSTRYSVTNCSFDSLNLLHTDYNNPNGTERTCMIISGKVTARSVRTNGSCYISNLTICVLPDTAITVACYHDNGQNNTLIGNITLESGQLTTTNPSQPLSTLVTSAAKPDVTTVSSSSPQGLSDGGIAGLSVAMPIVVILLIGLTIVIVWKLYKRKSAVKEKPPRDNREREATDSEMQQLITRTCEAAFQRYKEILDTELKQKNDELEMKKNELKEKNDIISQTREALVKNNELIEENNKLTKENTLLNEKNMSLTKENRDLQDKLSAAKKEADLLRMKVENMSHVNKELLKLREDIRNLNNEKASQQDVEKVQRELNKLSDFLKPEVLRELKAVTEEQIVTNLSTTHDKGHYKNGHNSGKNVQEYSHRDSDQMKSAIQKSPTHRSVSVENNETLVES